MSAVTSIEITVRAVKHDDGPVVCEPDFTIMSGPLSRKADGHELAKRALNAMRIMLHDHGLLDNPYCTQASNTTTPPQDDPLTHAWRT
jgi:hypothetical protein